MNTLIRISAIALAVSLLGACATTNPDAMTSPPPSQAKKQQYRYVTDSDYIRYYEKTAMRRNFVHVNWVNVPKKRVAVEDDTE
ncbi:hypothetical protein [Agrilutibacter solisilvae]|uniref:Lipoprotein n=1 Tax=Agrilutibacter solisilvae TaxID=2763317 RepID=A0A974XW82_9GAMM|nr:hypothetical protein [Lysobacter solisilvae]QSX77037.1 hypothetical protein I8J32_009470 [Lysobacter solisilvae]